MLDTALSVLGVFGPGLLIAAALTLALLWLVLYLSILLQSSPVTGGDDKSMVQRVNRLFDRFELLRSSKETRLSLVDRPTLAV